MAYAQGPKATWNETGVKQVAVVGAEEKRAFTLMVGVTASGEALPFQAIYKGKTALSLPVETESNGAFWKKAAEYGIQFEFSGTDTYWSTMDTMKSYVNNILAPYFAKARAEHGEPEDQLAIWQIDAWSVHRSAEFRDWMKKTHPTIQLEYVPGGCTGIWQPCDVGIQRLLKHEAHRASRADVIAEALQHLDQAEASDSDTIDVSAIQLDKRVGVLRDRSVSWLVKAFEVINHPDFVRKAFERCCLEAEPQFNLSHTSLTSSATLKALKNLPKTDPLLWAELQENQSRPKGKEADEDDDDDSEFNDDLMIPSTVLREHFIEGNAAGRGFVENHDAGGILVPASIAETLDDEAADIDHEFAQVDDEPAQDDARMMGSASGSSKPVEMGRGKRTKRPNRRNAFWEEA